MPGTSEISPSHRNGEGLTCLTWRHTLLLSNEQSPTVAKLFSGLLGNNYLRLFKKGEKVPFENGFQHSNTLNAFCIHSRHFKMFSVNKVEKAGLLLRFKFSGKLPVSITKIHKVRKNSLIMGPVLQAWGILTMW